MGFLLCAECARHVRAEDEKCPFCSATRRREVTRSRLRASRGAMLGAAAVAIACGTTAPGDDAGADAAQNDSSAYDGPIAMYGGPPLDAATNDAQQDATPDGPIAAYGGPPVDGGNG